MPFGKSGCQLLAVISEAVFLYFRTFLKSDKGAFAQLD